MAFVDVLGTKAMDGDEERGLRRLLSARARVKDFLGETPHYASVTFTDNTVLSWRARDDQGDVIPALAWIVDELAAFQLAFTVDGILLRGGVEFGALAIAPEFVFGSALNAAYTAESRQAFWPRITVSDRALEEMAEAIAAASDHPALEFRGLLIDEDDIAFIHYLAWVVHSGMPRFYLSRHRRAILSGLEACKRDPRASDKLRWAVAYHDFAVDELGFSDLTISDGADHQFRHA